MPADPRAGLSMATHARPTAIQRRHHSAGIREELIESLRSLGDWIERDSYDPYVHAKELEVDLWYGHLGEPVGNGVLGLTSWSPGRDARVCIQPDLSFGQARATLAHELVHVVVGRDDRAHGPAERRTFTMRAYEEAVDEVASLRLVPFDRLLAAAQHSHTLRQLGLGCQVDDEMTRARLRTLNSDQATEVRRAMGRARARVTRARQAALGCEDHRPGWTCLTHPDGHRTHLRPRKPTTPTATTTERYAS